MPLIHKLDSGKKVELAKIDPEFDSGLQKDAVIEPTLQLTNRLKELTDLMYFAGNNSLLIVLQGMDTSGKDGTIRCLLQAIDSQGAHSHPFKVPTPVELAHDFLWRCHAKTPAKGEISIFNRSHYEDVLVVRVHNFVPETVWSKRYDMINQFENLLADNETIILKFFLHISKDEQEKRLLEREQEVEKAWKLSVGDWKERQFWDEYQSAYESCLEKCNSEKAPWIIVPSNKMWFRNYAVLEAIVNALEPFEQGWMAKLEAIGAKAKAELAEFKAQL